MCFSKTTMLVLCWIKRIKVLHQWDTVNGFLFYVSESSDGLLVFVLRSFNTVCCSGGVYPSLEELQTPVRLSLASWLAWETWGSWHLSASLSFTLLPTWCRLEDNSHALNILRQELLCHLQSAPMSLLTFFIPKTPTFHRAPPWNGLSWCSCSYQMTGLINY